jgi:hypothetical protein
MNWSEIKYKSNTVWLGLVSGIILPVFGFFISKWVKFGDGDLITYWHMLIGKNIYSSEILTFSLLPNMLMFYFYFFQWKTDQAAKGLIFATLIWVAIIFLQY